MAEFAEELAPYGFADAGIPLGRPFTDGEAVITSVEMRLPLAMMNRHGLIAGATGTGKTKTLQLLAEGLSAAGVPVIAADMKGDLAGLAAPGSDERLGARVAELGQDWVPRAAPVELLSLAGEGGTPLRASVAGFGPVLLAKVLGLNETQESSLRLVFRFCDDSALPLVGLEDLRAALAWLAGPGKAELGALGGLSGATVGVLQRKVTQLESEGGDVLFGEPEFDVADLLRTSADGRGVISVIGLTDLAEQPALFSAFLMWVLAELQETLPEVGDADRPRVVFFLDEAHLLFDDATEGFREAVAQTVRLIRSKGVGVFFVTQLSTDLPDEVLGQLGHRVQHAVRAFTPRDAEALKNTVQTFPTTGRYDLVATLQSLGVGEAVVTGLHPRGVPMPVAATRLYAPASRMGPLTLEERERAVAASPLRARYADEVDPQSAADILAARRKGDRQAVRRAEERATRRPSPRRTRAARRPAPRPEPELADRVGVLLRSPVARTVGREVARGLFGLLRRR